MSDNVIPIGGITKLDLPVDRILEQAKDWCAESVVVIGWNEDGELGFASSCADGGEVLWLLEQAKLALLSVGE